MVDRRVTEYVWQTPKRGVARVADRAVLLAHGAGSDMHGAALVAVADALAAAGVASLRFNYPYRTNGKGAPDRPAVLEAATREAAAELARRAKLPPERLVLGGRSMGGRYCSMVVGAAEDPVPALGLLLLGYPLHAAGQARPAARRALPAHPRAGAVRERHARRARADATGSLPPPGRSRAPRTFHWIDTADHGYRPLKSSGQTIDARARRGGCDRRAFG